MKSFKLNLNKINLSELKQIKKSNFFKKREDINKEKFHIKSFDGLRAIAVILVMLYHIIPHIVPGGYLGVVIFLVLSGYLVTDNFLREMDKHMYLDIIKFWKKRVVKLYTPLLPMLSIVSLFVLLFFNDMLNDYVGNLFSSIFGINNIYQILHGLSYFDAHGNPNPFTHLWSLGLEVQFYLIWPILISLLYRTFKLRRKSLAVITLILSLASATTMFMLFSQNTDVSRIYYGIDTRAFSFLIGCFFAFLFPRNKVQEIQLSKTKSICVSIISIILFLGILYLSVTMDAKMDIVYKFGMYLYSILIGILLILLLLKDNIINKFFCFTPFIEIGKRSYSLYLWQYPITIFIGDYLKWSKISIIYLVLLELLFSIIFAEISYRLFEGKENYLTYINKKCSEDIKNRNLFSAIGILAIFIIFATSILSISQKTDDIEELKTKLENIQKNNAQNIVNNNQEIPNKEELNKKNSNNEPTKKPENNIDLSTTEITFIGDSIMLSASDVIKSEFKNAIVDAKVSRQAWDLPKVLDHLKETNNIKDIVVIHLGSNYKINKEKFKANLESLGNRKIFLINCVVPDPWEEQVNTTLKELSDEMENVEVIDWYSFAKDKKELFYKDATHPNGQGSKEYTNLLKTELSKYLKKEH